MGNYKGYTKDWDVKELPIPIDEIVRDYQEAKRPTEQIDILADLCGTKPCRIAWILQRSGLKVNPNKLPRKTRNPETRDYVKFWEEGPDAEICDRIRERLEALKASEGVEMKQERTEPTLAERLAEKKDSEDMDKKKMFESEDSIIKRLEKAVEEEEAEVSCSATFAWEDGGAEISRLGNSVEGLTGVDRRRAILTDAAVCVCTDRNAQYGEPENNFDVIAAMWSAYLRVPLKARDVADMMILFKVGRIGTAEVPSRDSYVDIAGYAACAGGIIE